MWFGEASPSSWSLTLRRVRKNAPCWATRATNFLSRACFCAMNSQVGRNVASETLLSPCFRGKYSEGWCGYFGPHACRGPALAVGKDMPYDHADLTHSEWWAGSSGSLEPLGCDARAMGLAACTWPRCCYSLPMGGQKWQLGKESRAFIQSLCQSPSPSMLPFLPDHGQREVVERLGKCFGALPPYGQAETAVSPASPSLLPAHQLMSSWSHYRSRATLALPL